MGYLYFEFYILSAVYEKFLLLSNRSWICDLYWISVFRFLYTLYRVWKVVWDICIWFLFTLCRVWDLHLIFIYPLPCMKRRKHTQSVFFWTRIWFALCLGIDPTLLGCIWISTAYFGTNLRMSSNPLIAFLLVWVFRTNKFWVEYWYLTALVIAIVDSGANLCLRCLMYICHILDFQSISPIVSLVNIERVRHCLKE